MNKDTLYFIAGLPRSGSTLITNILKQNPEIHGESVSSLSSIFGTVNANWNNIDANKEYRNDKAKLGVLNGILEGYYSHVNKPIVFIDGLVDVVNHHLVHRFDGIKISDLFERNGSIFISPISYSSYDIRM